MPWTVGGFGTIYYGNREKAGDGSFVTTLWAVLLFMPVVPLGSYRVQPLGGAKGFSFVAVPGRYIARKTTMSVRQVVNVYACFYGTATLLLAVGAIWIFR